MGGLVHHAKSRCMMIYAFPGIQGRAGFRTVVMRKLDLRSCSSVLPLRTTHFLLGVLLPLPRPLPLFCFPGFFFSSPMSLPALGVIFAATLRAKPKAQAKMPAGLGVGWFSVPDQSSSMLEGWSGSPRRTHSSSFLGSSFLLFPSPFLKPNMVRRFDSNLVCLSVCQNGLFFFAC